MNILNNKIIILIIFLLSSFIASAQNTGQATTEGEGMNYSFAKNAEYFSKGLEEKYKEDFDAAIENFENALKVFPEDHASMYELSVLYGLKGMNDKGFEIMKKAVELDSTNKWYKIRLADFYKFYNDYESFVSIYDKLLDDEPNNINYLEVYIDALLHIGEFEKVIEQLDVLEDNIGINEYVSLEKIEIYKLLDNKEKVIEEMRRLSEAYPHNTRYMSMLAEIYMQNKKEDEAFDLYLKIKKLNPEDPYINISLLEYYQKKGDLDNAYNEFILSIKNKNLDYNTKAQIYEYWFQNKESDEYIVKEAKEAGDAFIEAHPDKEIGYYVLGTVHYNEKMYEKAQSYYLDALERDSSSFISWYQLVFTDLELGDPESTYAHTEKALRFYPEQPIFYLLKGAALMEMKKFDEAIKVLEKGRFLSADKKLTSSFDTYIADSYHELGNKEKMYEYYDKVLKNNPEEVYVLNNYAYFLSLDNKDLEKALKMSAITIEKEPKNVTFIDTYAWVLYKLGRYKDAKKWMEKVFSYDKNPQGVNYEHYGDILYMLGDTKKAVQNWKKAKKLGECSEFIDQKIRDEKLYE